MIKDQIARHRDTSLYTPPLSFRNREAARHTFANIKAAIVQKFAVLTSIKVITNLPEITLDTSTTQSILRHQSSALALG